MGSAQLLIVTLSIDQQSQAFFDRLRTAHFPAHTNYLKAHITLFHRLPAGEDQVTAIIRSYNRYERFSLTAERIQNTGNGNAYMLESATLKYMHRAMQAELASWLIPRDMLPLKPYITVQNKVTAYKASSLNRQLGESFQRFDLVATGLSIWLYRNGPWEHLEDISFK